MDKRSFSKMVCAFFVFCAAATASHSQAFKTLTNFDNADGNFPTATLVQATNGDFYGTTAGGGSSGYGTVFKITPGGKLTTLHSFVGTEGAGSEAPLVQATDGSFYGTAHEGGANGQGSVFKITAWGTTTLLYSFCAQPNCADGSVPWAGLVQATNGDLYGTTSMSDGDLGGGTVFKITTGGALTTVYSFCAQPNCTDGAGSYSGLVRAADGDFYGMTEYGGVSGCGTVFKITVAGKLTTLHSFECADGLYPNPTSVLVQATNGDFYGTTSAGGENMCYGQVGDVGCGTVFRITPGGTLTTLHSFDGNDGYTPVAGLVQATDGNFYGTTISGGDLTCSPPSGCGTVFKITPGGTLTTLHSFDLTDGLALQAGLAQATSGDFYGTTNGGGAYNYGTVFSLSVGLGPFVKTKPASGRVGAAIIILGTNLTGATSVTFNGTKATFAVVSKSQITTTVPTGATTGKVKVKTPSGTLTSNVTFQVP